MYITRVITNLSGISLRYINNWHRAIGIVGTGTDVNYYRGFYQSIAYDFGSTPTNINVSSLIKTTNTSQVAAAKAFFTLVS